MSDEVLDENRGRLPARTGETPLRAVREHLIFFLGLVPITIAAMRVYLMAQGDVGVMLTLVKTLDLRELFLGTFIRFIGLFGVTTTTYVFCRVFWPLLTRQEEPLKTDGEASLRLPRLGWSALSVLLLVFLASLGCVYPEQVLDTKFSLGPIDLVRSLAWVVCGYAVLRVAGFRILRRIPGVRVRPRHRRGRRRLFGEDRLRPYKPEVFIVAPAVLLLFWSYLITNDRMWLPAQIVELGTRPPVLSDQSGGQGLDPVVTTPHSTTAFIGYVVESDLVEATIVRPGGGVVTTRRDNIVDLTTCQYEPDFDPGGDAPLIVHLAGSDFERTRGARETKPCGDVLADAERNPG